MTTTLGKRGFHEDEENYIPVDNRDLVRFYGSYVARLNAKYNRVLTNSEDLLQHIWQQLFHVDVLGKYNKSPGNKVRQLPAEQAALYLRMTWSQFTFLVKGGRPIGFRDDFPNNITSSVFDRDLGVCRDESHPEPFDTVAFSRLLLRLSLKSAPTYSVYSKRLSDMGISDRTTRFWSVEEDSGQGLEAYRTTCLFCIIRKHKEARASSGEALVPILGDPGSRKAIYDVMDLEKIRLAREDAARSKEHKYPPFEIPSTKARFKLYLARAVHNIYANWCRTRSRKYQELYLAPTEEGQAWESFLPDNGLSDPEAKLIVTQEVNNNVDRIIEKLSRRVRNGELERETLVSLLQEGHTLSEILKKLNMPKTALKVINGRYG